MSVAEVRRNVPDLALSDYAPEAEFHASSYTGSSRAWGLVFCGWVDKDEVYEIDLLVDPDLPDEDSERFNGVLSCGLSFAGAKPVTREEVTGLLGNPSYRLRDSGGRAPEGVVTNLPAQLRQGRIVSWETPATTSQPDLETLYYPTDGLIFNLASGIVWRVVVKNKIVPELRPDAP